MNSKGWTPSRLRLRGHVTYLDDEPQSLYNQIFRGA